MLATTRAITLISLMSPRAGNGFRSASPAVRSRISAWQRTPSAALRPLLLCPFCPPAPDGRLALYAPAAPPNLSNVVYDFSNLAIPSAPERAGGGRFVVGPAHQRAVVRWDTAYPDQLQRRRSGTAPCLPDHDAVAVTAQPARTVTGFIPA